MKSVVLFLSGVAAMLAGAFIRSCGEGLSSQLASAWCGAPLQSLSLAHQHCAGCGLMAMGGGLVALPLLLRLRPQRRHVSAS